MCYSIPMPIPDYQTLMLPLLRFLEDNKEHSLQEAVEHLSNEYRLSPEERQQLLPSGQQTIIRNRVGWARTYMKKAGLIDPVKRGYFRLSDKGKEALKKKPEKINVHFLEQFSEFVAFRELHNKPHEKPEIVPDVEQTPEEALDGAYQRLREDLEAEILQQVKTVSPAFFERLVVELLVKMGYGGNLHDAGQAVGQSGDGGIDGIIKEDRLGLDVIYIQAKRWQGTVGRPEIQKFAGVLQGHRAKKGVFITSSDFSREALEFAEKIDSRIVLMDGLQLVRFMVDNNVGVSNSRIFEVKKIDSDYFEE
jgi:restriction system protein